jgi:hypothetical protein
LSHAVFAVLEETQMKLLWTLLKVVIALVIFVPLSLIVLGTVVGLAALAFRLAVLALLAYGAFKLGARLLGGPKPSHALKPIPQLKAEDPYYTAAIRELDRDLGEPAR